MKNSSLLVSEIFGTTVQGEGPSIGKLCVFLRLGGCNQHCHWCDTPYTWRFSDQFPHDWDIVYDKNKELKTMVPEAVVVELLKVGLRPGVMLVISGGEPMLQAEQVHSFLDWMGRSLDTAPRPEGVMSRIEIETAGTLWHEGLGNSANVFFNVSPKLENSGNSKELRYRPEVLDKFAMAGHAIFKFVVVSLGDFAEIDEIVASTMIRKEQVYIMPEGSSREKFIESQQRVAQAAIDRGYNLTTRLHILLWDKKRGV